MTIPTDQVPKPRWARILDTIMDVFGVLTAFGTIAIPLFAPRFEESFQELKLTPPPLTSFVLHYYPVLVLTATAGACALAYFTWRNRDAVARAGLPVAIVLLLAVQACATGYALALPLLRLLEEMRGPS